MTETKYQLREVTPKEMGCIAAACPSVYEGVREKTPEEMRCIGGLGCPAVYEGIREATPQEMKCLLASCPSIYEAMTDVTPEAMNCIAGACDRVIEATKPVYLIIGKQVDPKVAGLEQKVGTGEVLIEVPRALIDGRER